MIWPLNTLAQPQHTKINITSLATIANPQAYKPLKITSALQLAAMSSNGSGNLDSNANLMHLLGQLTGNRDNGRTQHQPSDASSTQSDYGARSTDNGNKKEQSSYGYGAVEDFLNSIPILNHSSATASSESSIDPTHIITYQQALRYIVNEMIPNQPEFVEACCSLADKQQHAEVSWWDKRQALIKSQASKKQGSEKLVSLVSRFEGTSPATQSSHFKELEKQHRLELERYDAWVYKQAVVLMDAAKATLRELKVPLICVDEAYAYSKGISKKQLDTDVKRILIFLQDFCEDENAEYDSNVDNKLG